MANRARFQPKRPFYALSPGLRGLLGDHRPVELEPHPLRPQHRRPGSGCCSSPSTGDGRRPPPTSPTTTPGSRARPTRATATPPSRPTATASASSAAPPAPTARDNTGTTYTDGDKGVPIYWLERQPRSPTNTRTSTTGRLGRRGQPPRAATAAAISRPTSTGSGLAATTDGHGGVQLQFSESRAFGAQRGIVRTGWLNHSLVDDPLDSDGRRSAPATSYRYYALSRVFTVGCAGRGSEQRAGVQRTPRPRRAAWRRTRARGDQRRRRRRGQPTPTSATRWCTASRGHGRGGRSTIVSSSGQIQTKSGVSYDHETQVELRRDR